ncbi:uncharacterized protein LOC113279463 [Papaver somniferum]|uniref:uncharacterized protein LOC113279463 n=1 Tax=Papaver somniferum TaxID=3469 RepID=UPI000E6FC47B|nr:uncharacterized protein LOC113279463 [Papaver somniferum]
MIQILIRTLHDNPMIWHEQLPMALWAYRTASRSSTRTSPYSLAYDADIVLPEEIKIPSATPYSLANKHVSHLLEGYGIRQVFFTPYRPRGNGQAESTKKTLIRILCRTVHDNPRTWNEQLPIALWAYCTASRISTGTSPYSLVYGVDVVFPAEIKILSSRIAATSEVQWNEYEISNSRIKELDTLDSRRTKAEDHAELLKKSLQGV